MFNSANFKLLLAALAVVFSVYACVHKSNVGRVPLLPGAVVQGEPLQDDGARKAAFGHRNHTITPVARFTVRARLLRAERYRFDRESAVAPLDFALGWNDMSNDAVLSRLDISQANRWYMYRWGPEGPPVPPEVIARNSANMHLIPTNDDVLRRLERVPPGSIVTLSGWLVDVAGGDNWSWRTSRTRSDTGNGACEIVWVEDVQLGGD
jgi:hypothetical protein